MSKLVFVIVLFLSVFLLGCINTNSQVAPSGEQVVDQPTSAGADAGQSESDEGSSSQGPAPSNTPPSFPE